MNKSIHMVMRRIWVRRVTLLVWLGVLSDAGPLEAQVVQRDPRFGTMIQKQRIVLFQRPPGGPTNAVPGQALERFGDQLETKIGSQATVQFNDLNHVLLRERTILEIAPQDQPGAGFAGRIVQGGAYFAGYRTGQEVLLATPHGHITPVGTEFVIEVEEGMSRVIMLDGRATLSNAMGSLTVDAGMLGVIEPGQRPRTARLEAQNIVQWWLYYPAVLDPADIDLPDAEQAAYDDSLEAYRNGDLPGALEALPGYPEPQPDVSGRALLLQAQLWLAAGSVREALSLMERVPGQTSQKRALERLIAAVTLGAAPRDTDPETASEWLAESYVWQARRDLDRAVEAARQALERSPDFAFAMVRVAELEFGSGRNDRAEQALRQALKLAPAHAQAHALQGFLLAGRNQRQAAAQAFETALDLDSSLGNAWLGRGLLKFREGDRAGGLEDLKTAAVLEPNRALLHSYLGKAFQQAGRTVPAGKELSYAKRLDEMDPTPWLYSALLHHQQNRVNQGVADLEHSARLNDNRAVYRSRLMLDEDAAVRGVNLAHLYEDAGLDSVGVRTAARGVNASYTTFSGHLFLADTYSQLLDPGRVGLRFETAASTEYLLANLLAPVGAGVLSPTLSQQEYSSLFQQDGLGVVSSTEYLSRGAWSQQGSIHATHGTTSASLDALYLTDDGQQPNNDLELASYSLRLKQQVSSNGDIYGQVLWSDGETGDRLPRYQPEAAFTNGGPNTLVRVQERQEPIVLAGYHHTWSPGQHSLALAGYVRDDLQVMNPRQVVPTVITTANSLRQLPYDQHYQSDFELGLIELQHIAEQSSHALILGGRYQGGRFEVDNRAQTAAFGPGLSFTVAEAVEVGLQRASAYAYYQYEILPQFSAQAGVSYDWMEYPANVRYAPVIDEQETEHQVSPKAGLLWAPTDRTSMSLGYARFLTGVSLEQSLRLEPTQVGGINQAYRSVIPDTVTGANSAEQADTVGLLVDHRFPTRTYAGLTAYSLWSDSERAEGYYSFVPFQLIPQTLQRDLEYQEQSAGISLHQLLGDAWSVGAHYRVSRAELESTVRGLPPGLLTPSGAPIQPRQELTGWLHQVRIFAVFNHPSGFFARGESDWYQQSNQGYEPDHPGDDFWQFNLLAGWRFLQRRVEVAAGVLNVTDQDYRLDPINLYSDLPRERTFYTRLRFSF